MICRHFKISSLLSLVFACSASGVFAADPVTPKSLDVIDNQGDLILIEKDKKTRYITPKEINSTGSFLVKIQRERAKEEEARKAPTQDEKIEARKLMFEANQAFFKGEFQKVWDLIDQAENLDPEFYRIKSMKGSLLYRIGSKDLAVSLWQESLKVNPDQPDIIELLQNTQKELGPR